MPWSIYIFKRRFVVVGKIEAEYQFQRCLTIVTDHDISSKFEIVHLQSNPDSMKPA